MTTRFKLLILGAIISLGLIIGVVLSSDHFASEPSPQLFYDLVSDHLKAFQKEDFSSAYAMTSGNLRRAVSEPQFAALMKQYGLDTLDYRFVEFGPFLCKGNRAEMDINGISGKNGSLFFRYYFVRESGKWKVESFQLCSEPRRPLRQVRKST
ncbi:MAG: DUF4864 domain-containing protein [Chthoniobacterales bacterium]